MEIVPTFFRATGAPIPDDVIAQKLEEERERRRKRYFSPLFPPLPCFLYLNVIKVYNGVSFQALDEEKEGE